MKFKKGDVCMVVDDKEPCFHYMGEGNIVLITHIFPFNSNPYWSRYCEEGRNGIHEDFKESELVKIGRL